MKIYYDEETDAAYIKLSEEKPSGVIEIITLTPRVCLKEKSYESF